MYRNYKPESDIKIEEERMAALEEQRKLKELEEEEYRRRLEEAREAARDNIRNNDKLHKNTSDLLILLESFERMKDKEDEQDKSNKNSDESNEELHKDSLKKEVDSDSSFSTGKAIETLASHTVKSAFMKEAHSIQSVDRFMAAGHADISAGRDILNKVTQRAGNSTNGSCF